MTERCQFCQERDAGVVQEEKLNTDVSYKQKGNG